MMMLLVMVLMAWGYWTGGRSVHSVVTDKGESGCDTGVVVVVVNDGGNDVNVINNIVIEDADIVV